jgi:hypothetical protein
MEAGLVHPRLPSTQGLLIYLATAGEKAFLIEQFKPGPLKPKDETAKGSSRTSVPLSALPDERGGGWAFNRSPHVW